MKLENSAVKNLLCAMTSLAYDDYVNGGVLLSQSEYEIHDGVINLISINGKPYKSFGGRKRNYLNSMTNNYSTAKKFFEDTELGEYLLKKADEEIKLGKYRRTRRIEEDRYEASEALTTT